VREGKAPKDRGKTGREKRTVRKTEISEKWEIREISQRYQEKRER
jgi:hypothetical protein